MGFNDRDIMGIYEYIYIYIYKYEYMIYDPRKAGCQDSQRVEFCCLNGVCSHGKD